MDRSRTGGARRGASRGAARRRAGGPDRQGVRPALVPGLEPELRLLARPADAPRLGLLGRARYRHRHRPRAPAAREARGRPVAPRAARDGVGRRLPVPRMSIRWQLTLLAVAAVCLPLAAVVGFGLVMVGLHDDGKLVVVALASLLLALTAALGV